MSLANVEGDLTQLQQNDTSAALADGVFDVFDNPIFMILGAAAALIFLVSIFLFNQRKRQISLTRIGVVLSILMIVLTAILFYQDYNRLTAGEYQFEIGYGILSPLAAIVFGALAMYFIKKDDHKVRSMDRLR